MTYQYIHVECFNSTDFKSSGWNVSPSKQLEVLFQLCDWFWLWQQILLTLQQHHSKLAGCPTVWCLDFWVDHQVGCPSSEHRTLHQNLSWSLSWMTDGFLCWSSGWLAQLNTQITEKQGTTNISTPQLWKECWYICSKSGQPAEVGPFSTRQRSAEEPCGLKCIFRFAFLAETKKLAKLIMKANRKKL